MDFYSAVPLLEGQGCIAGPKEAWVGIYWVVPTVLYTASVSISPIIVPIATLTHASADGSRLCPFHRILEIKDIDPVETYVTRWVESLCREGLSFLRPPLKD